MTFDPRTMGQPVYESLTRLRGNRVPTNDAQKKELLEQKNQAIELYTYLSTWGLLRLKAEEKALKTQKQAVVVEFFNCLNGVWQPENYNISGNGGLQVILDIRNVEEYLGLTGLALALAQEFNFWAQSVYGDVDANGGNENANSY